MVNQEWRQNWRKYVPEQPQAEQGCHVALNFLTVSKWIFQRLMRNLGNKLNIYSTHFVLNLLLC